MSSCVHFWPSGGRKLNTALKKPVVGGLRVVTFSITDLMNRLNEPGLLLQSCLTFMCVVEITVVVSINTKII